MNLLQTAANYPEEFFETLLEKPGIRFERIISDGHKSPDEFWYDQTEDEVVVVLSGYGILEFENGELIRLDRGMFFHIPKNCRHRVAETSKDEKTIWFAIFF